MVRRFFTLVSILLALIFAATVAPRPAFAEKRVALVIGNGAYRNATLLPNPRNDAEDVAAALGRTGFEVIRGFDFDKAKMEEAAVQFSRAARTADVAVFYYSGHAMQFAGVNYLVPIDAILTDEADLHRMIKVDDFITDLRQAKNLRILVLDSCRDNPLAEQLKRSIGGARALSMQRGLAKIDSPEGMIVSYATQAGRTAEDGTGRNSPYTTAFLKHIEEQDEIGTIFRRTATDVYESTDHEQLPELSLSFVGEFYLRGRLEIAVPPKPPALDACAAAGDHWKSAEAIGTLAAFEDHLARFPNCAFEGLAKARIENLKNKVAVTAPPTANLDEKAPITDLSLLKEVRERLYELSFEPGAFEGPDNEATREAIRLFEGKYNLTETGTASIGLLQRLREAPSLKPWGALVYDENSQKWGMSWGEDTRRAAVARARASCGDVNNCLVEESFFGSLCSLYVRSAGSRGVYTGKSSYIGEMKEAALKNCGRKPCQVLASVCADGTQQLNAR
jgi:uncharacterized caspase-like protein